jgi:diadenosine tetraphosphate (Ap4A) HIT family hydrolase
MQSMCSNTAAGCIFCDLRGKSDRPVLARTESFFAVNDRYPVNVGHTLLIPDRHVCRLRDLSVEEFADFKRILEVVQDTLMKQGAEGFNIGINEGEVAGQTVGHLHIHVIPRYRGDVESPRGGVRNLKPALVEY